MIERILAILLSTPLVEGETESPEERQARLRVAAEAITAALERRAAQMPPVELAAALLALGTHESHWSALVGTGRCHETRWRCDDGRARGYWQSWRVACPRLWQHEDGSPEAVMVAADCAAGLLVAAHRRCDRGWAGAFSGYRGASCSWEGATPRAATLQRFLARL